MSRARSRARRFALQALYQWQLNAQDTAQIEAQFLADDEQDLATCEVAYFHELLHQVPRRLDQVDAELARFLDRPVAALDPVEKAILRLGTYELMCRLEVPYRVVINEGVELAKQFGATDGYKYVNGVLDKVAGRLRAVEVNEVRRARRRAAER